METNLCSHKLCKCRRFFWIAINRLNPYKQFKYSPIKENIKSTLVFIFVGAFAYILLSSYDADLVSYMSNNVSTVILSLSAVIVAILHLTSTKRIAQANIIFEMNKGFLETTEFISLLEKVESVELITPQSNVKVNMSCHPI